jgi:hypothetical protein
VKTILACVAGFAFYWLMTGPLAGLGIAVVIIALIAWMDRPEGE